MSLSAWLICCLCAAEYMLTPAQGCFMVPAASAEAVVLTLSGLTANVALQVASCLAHRMIFLSGSCNLSMLTYLFSKS